MAKQRKVQRPRRNSEATRSAQIGGVSTPPGVEFDTQSELDLWESYTSSRLAEDWRPSDLQQIAEVVRLHNEYRKLWDQYQAEGAIVVKANGDTAVNPLLQAMDKHEAKRMSIVRSLNLNVNPNPIGTNGAAVSAAKSSGRSMSHDGPESLLAIN